MKQVTEEDLKRIDDELAKKKAEYEATNFISLEAKLKWINDFFAEYILQLEKEFLTEEEFNNWVQLPDEIRIKYYQYFPEHGLNIAHALDQLNVEKNSLSNENESLKRSLRMFLRH
ncbi:MAG: hypothetical protein J5892_01415 [Bacilli bacterium]|nr:hypothetical protein [Bacilli bacterium]